MRRLISSGFIVLALVAGGCGDDQAPGATPTPSVEPPAATAAPTTGQPTATATQAATQAATPSPNSAAAALRFGGIPNRPDVLTDAAGRAVYVFSGDEHGAVTCLGACAAQWPGVPTVGDAVVEGGKDYDGGAQGLGGGRWQATFSGDPLYYYSGDKAPGRANGVGRRAFGGTFYLVTKNYRLLLR